MKKRILSLVLCAAMLLSMCLFLGAGVTNSLTVCDSSGEAVKRVDLPVNQKISLTAQAQSAAENDAYQWQIRAAKDVWANILGSDTQTLELSYPMVASALSEKNTVQIRCRLTSAETGEATFSDAVTVEVTAATAVDTPASADAAAAPVLRSPAKVAAAVNDAPEYRTYTIIINYVFANGNTAAQSWTATVAKGSDYSAMITSPTVVGYAPDQETVTINEKNIQADKTFTVTYSPALVDFTVKYYQQNVNDDKYSLFETKTKQGYTEDPVSKYATGTNGFAANYDGFTRLLYDDTATIAADGSTVVELYYDRNYYLMNFNLDGGYGVEPIYARYGAPINVDKPTKPGYSFGGWDPELPGTMPAENRTFKAQWEKGSAKYVIQYWQENANDDHYSYVEKVDKTGTVGTTVSGSDDKSNDKSYQGFTYNNEKTDKNITIKGDGSTVVNVYYDRNVYTVTFPKGKLTCGKVEHTHSSQTCCDKSHRWSCNGYGMYGRCNTNKCPVGYEHTHDSRCYSDLVIEAKYGASIGDKWPGGGWYVDRNENTAQSYLAVMPLGGKTFYGRQTGYYIFTATYYVEVLPGESGTTVSGRTYKQDHQDTANNNNNLSVTDEERYDLEGFTCNTDISTQNGENYDGAEFYYTRNSYELVYDDQYGIKKTERLPYEQTLSESENHKNNYEPAYPSGSLEAGAYTFGGWYTDPGCTHPVDWSAKMPAASVVLYAKWTPVTHTVTTWLTDAKDTPVNVGDTSSNEQTVAHRAQATKPADPTRGQYTFVGWFYTEDGVEKAFDFSMPVTKNLDLYAKWSSNTLVKYTIRYTLKDGTEIAPPSSGSALAGSTKTFEAKTGDQLNDGYRSGYFPTTSSHSITMDINGENEYTFEYVKMPEVKYTVKYLEKGTGIQLAEPKTKSTPDAVVTETFKQIDDYAPDAYQKRLVLAAENNEIIFWYVKDDTHAPVQIIHWTQNIAGDGYTERQSSTNLNGVIKTEYSETPLTIAGFQYNGLKSNAKGTLTAKGLVLNLYYDRIKYPYEFRFLEQGTDKQLAEPVTGIARYQAQVTETAKTISGYELVSGGNSQSMVIQIEDSDNVASKNVKTFYYREQTVDIKYVAVGSGTLDNYQETQLKVLHGTAKGSTPTPKDGYKFVGWYTDKDCTQKVDKDWVGDDNKLTPRKVNDVYKEATYYAKFELDVFDLTIEKTGTHIDQNQTFVFRVRGNNNNHDVDMQVVITGTNKQVIKNLPVGDYTITEDTNWSWKYTPVDGDEKTLTTSDIENGAATVTFENKNNGTNWLTSLAKALNKWTKDGTTVTRDPKN